MPAPTHRTLKPILSVPSSLTFTFGGWIGDRIRANETNWLIPAPATNPGMIDMFRQRLMSPMPDKPVAWAGEFAGKYLISAVQSLRLTANSDLRRVVQTFVAQLIATQGTADGSLGLPLSWDLWGQHHVMLGLLRWYELTGDASALNSCQRAADLACARYLAHPMNVLADNPDPGDGEKNQAIIQALALLYEYTGVDRYLQFVRAVVSAWTSKGVRYLENAHANQPYFKGIWKRWEGLHAIQGLAELYYVSADATYRDAFEQIWGSIRENDRHATGGFTSGELARGNAYDPRYIETCGTVAWMALTIDKLLMSADASAADELELSLFNAILGAQTPDGRLWTYHTPMGGIRIDTVDPPANRVGYRWPAFYDLAWQARDTYPQLSCCAANGPRGIGCLAEWAILQSDDAIYVNFYGAYSAQIIGPGGVAVLLTMSSNYPLDGAIQIKVSLLRHSTFTIRLRIPAFASRGSVAVNGTEITGSYMSGNYFGISRDWADGDVIMLLMDMPVKPVSGSAPADHLSVAYRGPLLLALDSADARYQALQPPTVKMAPAPTVATSGSNSLRVTFQSSQGPVVMREFASAGEPRAGSLLGRPNAGALWQFSRSDGTMIAERIQLLSNGSIAGYSHPNEARWGFDGDILTFYAASGAPSTRFTMQTKVHGKQLLTGFSLLDSKIRHILSEVDLNIIAKAWQFRRADGTILLPVVRMLPSGGFDVPTNPNEHRWTMESGNLVFYAANGAASTRFTHVTMKNGRTQWSGQFLFDGSITHEIVEIDPDVTASIWRFKRKDTIEVIADKVRLLVGGAIDGYHHPNEVRWEYGGSGTLVFFNSANGTSTNFEAVHVDERGAMRYEGTFLPDRSITHILEESAPGWDIESTYLSWLPFA
jgi:hypothetical protein